MADPLESRADPARQRLARSVLHPAPLEEVAAAVAVAAAEGERPIYVERRLGRYRWSLCHRGGGYPLLRIFASFLRVDHRGAFIGLHTVAGGWAIVAPEPSEWAEPDAWAILSEVELTGPGGVELAIARSLESPRV